MTAWNPGFSIGVEGIDAQHRALFEQVAAFEAAVAAGRPRRILEELLRYLTSYTNSHFEDEERLMREIGFPDRETHRSEHGDFIRRLGLLLPLWEEEEDSFAVLTTLLAFVKDWLVGHVAGSDQRVGAFRKSQPEAGSSGMGA
jgi:hemerythrin-like metal-binding protein